MEPMVKGLSDMIHNQGILHYVYFVFFFLLIPFLFCCGIRAKTVSESILRYQKTHGAFKMLNSEELKQQVFLGDIFTFIAIFLSSFVISVVLISSFEFLFISFFTFLDVRKRHKGEIEKFEKIIKPKFWGGCRDEDGIC